MWATIKNNYKTILITTGYFLVGIMIAYFFEEYYRQLVRFSFKFFNGDNIQFIGKNFHLYASDCFVTAFGIFLSLTFLLLKFSFRPNRLKRLYWIVILFFATTILITAFDSKLLLVECTACNDGIIQLTYNEVAYDKYFIISLMTATLYLVTVYLLERKQQKKTKVII